MQPATIDYLDASYMAGIDTSQTAGVVWNNSRQTRQYRPAHLHHEFLLKPISRDETDQDATSGKIDTNRDLSPCYQHTLEGELGDKQVSINIQETVDSIFNPNTAGSISKTAANQHNLSLYQQPISASSPKSPYSRTGSPSQAL